MDALLQALSSSEIAQFMRISRWGYAAAATFHIAGIALLIGSIFAYNLRLIGIGRAVPLEKLAGLLPPIAMIGFGLAVVSGALLALPDLARYAAFETFQVKLACIALAVASAAYARMRFGGDLSQASKGQHRRVAAISLIGWLGALIAGRMIAFVHG